MIPPKPAPAPRRRGMPGLSGVLRQLLLAAPIRLWALIAAGPPLTAFAAWVTWIVWRGPWSPDRQPQQLEILGWSLMTALVLVGVIVVSLAAVKVEAETKLGTFRVAGDDDDKPPAV